MQRKKQWWLLLFACASLWWIIVKKIGVKNVIRRILSNFENIFDSENVCVGGRHSSIVVPLDTFKSPNVSLPCVSNVITDVAGTLKKVFVPIFGDVSP